MSHATTTATELPTYEATDAPADRDSRYAPPRHVVLIVAAVIALLAAFGSGYGVGQMGDGSSTTNAAQGGFGGGPGLNGGQPPQGMNGSAQNGTPPAGAPSATDTSTGAAAGTSSSADAVTASTSTTGTSAA